MQTDGQRLEHDGGGGVGVHLQIGRAGNEVEVLAESPLEIRRRVFQRTEPVAPPLQAERRLLVDDAVETLPAGHPRLDVDAITRGQRASGAVLPDVRAELLDDADCLVTEHDGEGYSGQAAAIDIGVGATDSAQLLSHQESIWIGIGDFSLGDDKHPVRTVEDGRFAAHRYILLSEVDSKPFRQIRAKAIMAVILSPQAKNLVSYDHREERRDPATCSSFTG